MSVDVAAALKSQYHAALKTLRLAIEQCPDGVWDRAEDGRATFWRVAYHALFFTHYYLQKDEHSLTPWERHQDEAHMLGNVFWEGNRAPKASRAYSRGEILEYWGVVDGGVDGWVDAMDLGGATCGFHWYPMGKLEHQIVNIRHLAHHAAALSARLRRESGVEVAWVGRVTG